MMCICRTCLSKEVYEDIYKLQVDINDEDKNFVDIMSFCLDIQVTQDSKISTKLCSKCYQKIKSFYSFKVSALQNNEYLRSITDEKCNFIDEIFVDDYIKIEKPLQDNLLITKKDDTDLTVADVKVEHIKQEEDVDSDQYEGLQSDDELLSVIKTIKYEQEGRKEVLTDITEKIKVNDVKKRGRRKKEVSDKVTVIEEPQICHLCGKLFRNLTDHLKSHTPKCNRKPIKCDKCNKTFANHSSKYKHNKIKHLGIKSVCPLCKKTVVNLKQHHLVVHNTEALKFECVHCSRRFISQSVLDVHKSIHTKDRPFECSQCNKKYRLKLTLKQHIRQVHELEKSHLCQFCSKSFFKKYHLQLHLRSHTKEKPVECPDCGKRFSSTSIMKSHQMIHSNVKMFGCTLCDLSFVKPAYLRAHMASHLKEKRFPCQYCGVKFHRSDHRLRHQRTAHEKFLNSKTT